MVAGNGHESFRGSTRGAGLAIDRRVRLAPIVFAALVAVPAAAWADDRFYGGFGVSPGHQIDGDLARAYTSEGEVGGRFVLGQRHGNLAFELSFFGTDLHPAGLADPDADPDADLALDSSTLSLGAGLKQYLPLSPNVELFARVGVDRTWLVPYPDRAKAPRYDGYGLDYGAGIEAGTSGPRWGVRGWVDLGRQHLDLRDLTGSLTSITFGASIYRGY